GQRLLALPEVRPLVAPDDDPAREVDDRQLEQTLQRARVGARDHEQGAVDPGQPGAHRRDDIHAVGLAGDVRHGNPPPRPGATVDGCAYHGTFELYATGPLDM